MSTGSIQSTSLSAAEAAARLGVTRQTLYAYVSRGLLAALPGQDHRTRRYPRDAVEQLATARTRGRKPREIAKATLQLGLPVLESALTLIDRGRLFYRGEDAIVLAGESSLEDVAALLWQMPRATAFGRLDPALRDAFQDPPPPAQPDRIGPLLARFLTVTNDDHTAEWQRDPARIAAGCGELLRAFAACVLRRPPSEAPIAAQCAAAWGLDATGTRLVGMALILCADHELNASSFTARCIASTGASLRAAIVGGLAALSGSRHGGMTARVENFWRGIEAAGDPAQAVRALLAAGGEIPGFGHPLYPDGDARAKALLSGLEPLDGGGVPLWETVSALSGLHPTIDFALVALRRFLGLPEGAAFDIFAIGRAAGWIAQALEQRTIPGLIRPRSVYVGPQPTR